MIFKGYAAITHISTGGILTLIEHLPNRFYLPIDVTKHSMKYISLFLDHLFVYAHSDIIF